MSQWKVCADIVRSRARSFPARAPDIFFARKLWWTSAIANILLNRCSVVMGIPRQKLRIRKPSEGWQKSSQDGMLISYRVLLVSGMVRAIASHRWRSSTNWPQDVIARRLGGIDGMDSSDCAADAAAV